VRVLHREGNHERRTGAHRMTWDDLTEEELLKILAALIGKQLQSCIEL
jgi:hypothetical protein